MKKKYLLIFEIMFSEEGECARKSRKFEVTCSPDTLSSQIDAKQDEIEASISRSKDRVSGYNVLTSVSLTQVLEL